jgi:hypothetical protein
MKPVETLVQAWRSEADTLRRVGAGEAAATTERRAAELEEALREQNLEELAVREAAQESGYSEEHLRQLVRDGKLPDSRSPGSKGPITIRRCDLPRKPHSPDSVVRELAEALRRP